MKATILILVVVLAACTMADDPKTQPPEAIVAAQRAETQQAAPKPEVVAATEHFVFHSSLLLSLHDHLDWIADGEGEQSDCLRALTDDDREGWDRALAAYQSDLGKKDDLRSGGMVALRYRLAGIDGGEFGERFREPVDEIVELLDGAAPGYRKCIWKAQDERNRAWIAHAVPLVEAHEDVLAESLPRLFAKAWPETPTPVSVVHYGTWYGANTVLDPNHIMIGGDDEGNQGLNALEVVFHEVGHTMVGPWNGAVARALKAAGAELEVEVPRNLWHGILFYTVGQTVRDVLSDSGVTGFESFYEEVLPRAWPTFLEPLETEWQPYLDGEIGMDEAVRRLLSRMSESEETSG